MLSSAVIAKVSADPSLNGQCFGSGLFLSGGVAIVRSVCNFFRRDKFPLWLHQMSAFSSQGETPGEILISS